MWPNITFLFEVRTPGIVFTTPYFLHYLTNGKEATVNRTLDGSTYPG
jgi:hypothetical protein